MSIHPILRTGSALTLFLAANAATAEIHIDGRIVETKASAACALLVSTADQKYIDCGNGTVYDTAAGLFWLKDASCDLFGIGQAWPSAMSTVTSVRHGLDCDTDGTPDLTDGSQFEDWRLPTLREQLALIGAPSLAGCVPALFNDPGSGCFSDGPTAFIGVDESRGYWSATADEVNPAKAWAAVMGTADVSFHNKSSQFLLWPVRDALPHELPYAAQVESFPVETAEDDCLPGVGAAGQRYVDCGNGTVLDTVTDLVWLRDATCAQLPFLTGGQGDWIDAMGSAARLADGLCDLSDGSQPGDWRLPSALEWVATSERAVALGCSDLGAKDPPALTDTVGTGCLDDGTTLFTGVPAAAAGLRFWTRHSARPLSGGFDSALAFQLRLGTGSLVLAKDFTDVWVWPVRPRKGDI